MLPITVNNQYSRTFDGGVSLKREAKTYKEMVGFLAIKEKQNQKWIKTSEPLIAKAIYYVDEKSKRDSGNDKLTWDALEGIIYENDRQIIDQRNIMFRTKNYNKVVLIIKKITPKYYDKLEKILAEN